VRFQHTHRRSGSVLLEVVLALALFVAAATIISGGINASIHSVQRVRLHNHAVNLAVTVLSEMQMHIRPVAAVGPEPFAPPFQDWTYKVEIAQKDAAPDATDTLQPVEVIIRHSTEGTVQRLAQLFSSTEISTSETNSAPSLSVTP
jgi:hypothetical protein